MNKLKQWERATDNLRGVFIEKYFSDVPVDSYWVGSEIGGVLFINDHFFNLSDMVDYLKYDYSPEEMFQREEEMERPVEICIRDWKKFKGKV